MLAIGSQRELFTDNGLIAALGGGARLRLHHPEPREVALVCDAPWEGNGCLYVTVMQDGDRYRMYYRGGNYRITPTEYTEAHRLLYCYAESTDGIHWVKPELGLVDYEGSTRNNIILDGLGTHSFAPFRDPNPAAPPVCDTAASSGQPNSTLLKPVASCQSASTSTHKASEQSAGTLYSWRASSNSAANTTYAARRWA